MALATPGFPFFNERLRACFRSESLHYSSIKVAKQSTIYSCDDTAKNVYLLEMGQVKILAASMEGRECLLAIHTAGDIFGELSLATGIREETAVAMRDSMFRQISSTRFLAGLIRDGLQEEFIRYLVRRLADQQQIITSLVTANSEQRLAATLLHLARKLGKRDLRSLKIENHISHQELSNMVGTTRTRVGKFIQRFCDLGLIERSTGRALIIKEHPLAEYLETRGYIQRQLHWKINQKNAQ